MKLGVGVTSYLYKNLSLKVITGGGIGLSVLLASLSASADQFDTLNYAFSAGMTYDNNIFRLPSSVDPQTVIGKSTKSDHIQTESIGINLDKKYSNQDVQFKANVTNNKFSTFSYLNYFSTTYNAAWNWNLTSRWSGSLSDSRTQTLNSFADTHTYTRNLSTIDTRRLNADWWLDGSWHALLAVSNSKSTNSQQAINNQSYTVKTNEWGFKYVPADGSSISLISRTSRGNYSNGNLNYFLWIDTEYSESQKEFNFNWLLSGKSVLSGNLVSINHRYSTFYQRDYKGTQGGLNYIWSISDKATINFSRNRARNSWFDYSSSYYVIDTTSITPTWQISAKSKMHMSLTRSKADYLGAIVSNTVARQDNSRTEEIGLDWFPQRSVVLTTSVQKARRSTNSDYAAYEYEDKSVTFFLQLTF